MSLEVLKISRCADALPNSAVALEAAAEANLPHPVTVADPAFGLNVVGLIPKAAARGVAEAMQHHVQHLNMLR